MKVEFTLEEVQVMLDAVIDPLADLPGLTRADKAALKRWRQDGMRGVSADMKLLTDKMNSELQQAQDNLEARQIVKPDWA
jgi:hypothetical protein